MQESSSLARAHAATAPAPTLGSSPARLARLAQRALRAPIALVATQDHGRCILHVELGLGEGTDREAAWAILSPLRDDPLALSTPLLVGDTRQQDWPEAAVLRHLGIAACAAIAWHTQADEWTGILVVGDRVVRQWTSDDADALVELADLAGLLVAHTALEQGVAERTAALLASEARYRNLIHDLHVGVLIQGPQAEILLSNQAARDLLGLTEDQLLGKSSFDPDWNVVHEDGTPFSGDTHPVPRAIATRRPVRDVVMGVYRPRVGDRVWLLVSAEPQLVDGDVRHVVCTFSDITARRRREEDHHTLARAGQLLSSSLDYETTLASIARLAVPELADCCIVYINEGGRMIWHARLARSDTELDVLINELNSGYALAPDGLPDQVAAIRIGKAVLANDVLPEQLERAATDARHRELLRRLAPRSSMSIPLIARERALGAITLLATASRPRYDKEHLALAQEIARRAALALDNARLFRAAERSLAEFTTVQRVAQAINSAMNLGAIFKTVVTQIAEAFGYRLVSIYLREGDGLRLQAYMGYDDVMWFIHLDQGISGRVARTGLPVFVRAIEDDLDFIVVYPGTRQAIIVPLKHSDGQVVGTLAVESDGTPNLTDDDFVLLNLLADQISVAIVNARLYAEIQEELAERKRLEEERLALERQLLEAQKMESLGVLAGGIAHDFNNLLQVTLGNAGLARTDVTDQARVLKSLSRIELAAQRAAELTQQLLAYAGKGRYLVQQVDLDAVLAATLQQMRGSIGDSIALHYIPAAVVRPILADEAQLRQIARNLIANAAEAIGDGPGTVTVTTGVQRLERADLLATLFSPDLPPDDYVYVEVADDGPGIDQATQARIFEPFFSTKFTGRGLGLPAVLGSVRSHQGALRLWSTAREGTRIRVWLPALREESLAPAAMPAVIGGATPAQHRRPANPTLLIIDDEEGVRSVTARLLERAGYVVLKAANGRAGIAIFRSHAAEIACVLLDLTMPRFSGEQTLRELQLIEPDVPILLMSGYSEADATSRFAGRRLAGFLHKPFTPAELCARVERLLHP
jgi:PAS domain S-box-containing protein